MDHASVFAFWVTGPCRGELRPATLGRPGADEIVVDALFSGLSRGTEMTVFRGQVPESEWQRMRCPFQEGEFPAPVKYGYCLVGRVVDGPDSLLGRDVFVLHPHQTRCIVPASAAVPLPANVPAARAVLAANMETALNAVWDAAIGPCERVCVVGAGVVGLLTAWLAARTPGVRVDLLDIDPAKGEAAAALGLALLPSPAGLGEYDVVVHASGNPAGLRTCLDLAGFEARIIELSWYGNREVTLPLGEAFHARRLTIVSSQVGHVAPRQRTRWSRRQRLEAALNLLADARLDRLVSGESPFAELPQTTAAIESGALPALCHRIRYP